MRFGQVGHLLLTSDLHWLALGSLQGVQSSVSADIFQGPALLSRAVYLLFSLGFSGPRLVSQGPIAERLTGYGGC